MRVRPGTRLGRYEVVSHLATGGMGEVYRHLDRDGVGESGQRRAVMRAIEPKGPLIRTGARLYVLEQPSRPSFR